jgi:hypothetical protein
MSRRLLGRPRDARREGFLPLVTQDDGSKVMVLALVVAESSIIGGGQALAIHVGCGGTIITDTTLDTDLVNCPDNGMPAVLRRPPQNKDVTVWSRRLCDGATSETATH